MEWYHYLIAVFGGVAAGAINTLAGNGSAITLSILTEIVQLPGNVANGTNRVGILAQSLAGGWEFYRAGKFKFERSWGYIIITTLGSIAGVLVATWVSNEQFRGVFRFLMLFMLIVILVKPERWLRQTDLSSKPPFFLTLPVFLLLGFYGGFIQMGMGIFFLAVMVLLAKYSLTDANAVKVFTVGLFTILVTAIFHFKGLVDWRIGGILAVGQGLGGWLAARYAVRYKNADRLAYFLLVAIVTWALLRLFGVFDFLLRLAGYS